MLNNRTELLPGVHLTPIEVEKFKRCRVSICFVWKANRATATAEALLPLLLERCNADCPDMTDLSKRLAQLYGASLSADTSITGSNRILRVSVCGIQDKYALEGENLSAQYTELALATAFRPLFTNGVFDAENVAIETEQLRELLEGEINEKRSYCIKQARRKFYGENPAGIEENGYLEELDALTPQMITDAFAHMLETAQIEVMALGANTDAVREKIVEEIGRVANRNPQPLADYETMPRVEEQIFTQPMDTVQGKLCMMYTAGETIAPEEYEIMRVAGALLGGTPTSRLFMNVREKQSLCYYCAARILGRTGALCIDSGVEHQNAEAAKNAIRAELDALCTGEGSEDEMDETRRALENALGGVEDSLGGVESWYFNEILLDSFRTPQEAAAQIHAVTADEVQAALRRFTPSVTYCLTKETAL